MVKNLPAMQKTWVRSLGWEDTLEDSMATHSSILARRIPRTEEPGGLLAWSLEEWDTTKGLTLSQTEHHKININCGGHIPYNNLGTVNNVLTTDPVTHLLLPKHLFG